MLTYLRYLLVPGRAKLPEITVLSKDSDSLVFRCATELSPGVHKVCTRTSRGSVSFDMDIYYVEDRHGLYEGRVIPNTREPLVAPWGDLRPQEKALFGNLEEKFVMGARVSTSRPVLPGAIVRVEIEEQRHRLAQVLWCQKIGESRYSVRLSYREPEEIKKLIPEKNFLRV